MAVAAKGGEIMCAKQKSGGLLHSLEIKRAFKMILKALPEYIGNPACIDGVTLGFSDSIETGVKTLINCFN